jgi:hypothetical protein
LCCNSKENSYLKEGEKLKFDVSEDSPTEDEYDLKRKSAAPKIVFSK